MQKNKGYEVVDSETGKKKIVFDGRYTCVCAIVLAQEEDGLYVLANKRGPGCPNEIGKWNMPCGYMDVGSTEENCSREVYEETGLDIPPKEFSMVGISDTVNERNVTLRYMCIINKRLDLPSVESLKNLGGEENEVVEIKWINIKFLDKYQWAFKHNKVLVQTLAEIYGFQKQMQEIKEKVAE